jgi:hypothetical protein
LARPDRTNRDAGLLHSAAILNRSLDPERIARTAAASLAGAVALQYEREELT